MSKKIIEFFQSKPELSHSMLDKEPEVFKSIINNLPSLICVKDEHGTYTMVNNSFIDLAQVRPKEILGKNDVEVGLFLNPEQIMDADSQVFSTGQKKHIPLEPFTDKLGNLFWFTTTKIPLKDESGEVKAVAIISSNVTKKIAAEQQLKKSEQRYKSIFEDNYSGIIVVDKDLTILNKNKSFNVLVNDSSPNVLSIDDLKKYVGDKDVNDLKDLMNGVISRNYEYFDLSLQLIPVGKSKFPIETMCYVRGLYNQSGVFTEAVVTFQDITEQLAGQKALEESESRFRTIVENATDAILLLDYDTRTYLDANQNAVELFGYTIEEFKSINLGSLSPINQASGENSGEKSEEYMASAINGERVVYEWIVRRRNGKLVPCEVRLVKLPYKDKNIIRISVFDITERKKAEHLLTLEKQKLQDSYSELVDVNVQLENQTKQLQEFAYIASHNLRSPAGNITALINFYNNDPTEKNLALMMEKLEVVSDDLMDTIQDLAKVVQIKNELSKDREKINLIKVFDKTVESLSQTIKDLNASITHDFVQNCHLVVPKTYIDSIFLNFISNALKYSRDDAKPEIKISFKEAEDGVILSFIDNGLGIDLKRFGSKLFGLRKTFHKNKDSRGVGLFITKAQIESLGGSIDVKSEVNVGTEFHLRFPKSILEL